MEEVKEIKKGELLLTVGKDMSLTRFIEWLNETFKKRSKVPFTAQDAYGYIKRGNLPYHYGIYQLEGKSYPELGIKMVTVIDRNDKSV